MRPLDWVDGVGGWPGLMQGLVGVVLSVVVAAVTAWAILAGTRRHERRLADELDAKAAGRELISALTEAGLDLDDAIQKKDAAALGRLTIRLAGKFQSHLPALEVVDPEFVTNRLRPFAATLLDGLQQVVTSSDPWILKDSHRALLKNITGPSGLISLWLGYGNDRAGRRKLARVPDGQASELKVVTRPQPPAYRLW